MFAQHIKGYRAYFIEFISVNKKGSLVSEEKIYESINSIDFLVKYYIN